MLKTIRYAAFALIAVIAAIQMSWLGTTGLRELALRCARGTRFAREAVLVLGEMVLSPIGLSAVTSLSVPRVVGLMMGAWFLASAFGEMIAGRFGTWAAIAPRPDGSFDTAAALLVYSDVFIQLMWIGLVAGVIMLALTPWMKRASQGAR